MGPNKILVQKKLWSKKIMGPRKNFWSKKFEVQIFFGPNKIFDPQKIFSGQKNFWGLKFLGGQKNLNQEIFLSKNIESSRVNRGEGIGFLSVFVCVKYKTSRMLSSCIFWRGTSCSCCSCDRGKTKSTPSPWTWNVIESLFKFFKYEFFYLSNSSPKAKLQL